MPNEALRHANPFVTVKEFANINTEHGVIRILTSHDMHQADVIAACRAFLARKEREPQADEAPPARAA